MLTSIELFYLCSFFFSKVTPTNSVLSFFDTGSRKGIIGNLWVLLKPTCSLNQCGRGSSQFLGRHRWVSFFLLLVFVSASRGFYWVPRFSPLLKTNIPNSNSLWKVSPAGRGSQGATVYQYLELSSVTFVSFFSQSAVLSCKTDKTDRNVKPSRVKNCSMYNLRRLFLVSRMAYCHLSGLANPALDLHIQFLSSPNQLSLKRKWETPVSLGAFRN